MIMGPYINGAAVLLGGLAGAMLSTRLPERVRTSMPLIFGATSLCMGIVLVMKVAHMPVMVLSVILGALLGELVYLEKGIGRLGSKAKGLVEILLRVEKVSDEEHEKFLQSYVAIIVLFCASGTGIFGAMNEGMTGDTSVLIAKSFLDLFTAAIFATSLGFAVAIIAFPQLIIQLALAWSAVFILPLTNAQMQADFSAVGGVLMVATGLRICGIKLFPVANMLPSLVLAMPISAMWVSVF
ncbi:DUF554 domain-containing protein [Pluralibacter gergoviae]|uniref:DUF554 domain-containing protein n=1 Tax=Pluralibacter gergoviae TaxID=61647 RepID=A0A089PIB8_PLUGE|nr:DUF554 domain-containing protein [Pluralibacter gergoviae]AIR00012.1 hypothetical protein LG71_08940 [Pluralibacter gergoviae]AVR05789.1 DUF554 domain-containing protein [Pluralibacter gergoviae]EKT9640952.1 DUF554 domain-containing protein [Pluralibacter gergoviae]EKV0915550.1 DUF554 domain-containing protein [Pluralibacter gergoviae]EKV0929282.1 DUF554 domain-containing protein [Pluralibacter gergoviae]